MIHQNVFTKIDPSYLLCPRSQTKGERSQSRVTQLTQKKLL